MREIFENALTSWDKYWDGSFYPYLLLGAALYLLLFERKRKKAGYLLGYLGITLFLFVCPLTSALIQKCIGSMVYWRAIWLLPAVPVMACAFTGLAGKIRNAGLQIIPVVLCLTLVIFCGTSVWQAGNYVKVANRQKVPEETAQAAEVICRERSSQNSLVVADNHMASYLRVYDPSIQLAFGRDGKGRRSRNGKRLYEHLNAPEPDYTIVAKRAKKEKCELLIFRIPAEREAEVVGIMEKYGYQRISVIDNYSIFQIPIDILNEN